MKKLHFSTKAETLQRLEGKLSTAQVLPQYSFTVEEYTKKSRENLP